MNIPDDAFFTLLTRGIQQRGDATLQRALYQALREAILQGELLSHSRLPGARVIAQRAGISRNTVNSALEQLAIEGYLIRSRQGTYVAALNTLVESEPTPPKVVLPERLRALPLPGRRDSPALLLTTGMPAVNYFPLAIWRRLLDRVLREDGSTILGYGEAAGEPALREAIARHLTLSRGIRCTARQIVITEGALEGVNLCTHLLSEAGDTAWVEEPGYFGAKSVFIKAGLQIKGIAVDSDGMRPDTAEERAPRLIFTSPSHQYPSGAVMSAGRRLALLEYARQHDAWIIEDDYDSEFRYSGEPIQAMLGMVAQAPVVYLGTFSKTLFPSLRIGFAVMPPALAEAAQEAIGALLRGGHRLEQRALALFIEEGHYARHLASMRRLYRRRQQLLREAVASEFALANEIWGGEGGLHLTVAIDGIDDVQIVEQARRYQMAPAALSRFYLNQQTARSGLVLGYGNTSAAHFVPALRTLNRLIKQQRGSR
ncbi:TPA: PLP-dependent aminotransferase family protein [Klebsiella aerogenes]|uniref:MocR-like pyridoxine biosynthesis transcription factor PdxR n=1 Tax=Klebsiella TaxID=570 RepID=UPI000DDFEE4A|nr:PLP-dependent aminotransferase family protein [Klebsiella sp. 141203]MDU9364347.1 PLP-dependent aminotransferase family protein [Klebsiella sp. 141203]HBR7306354.1 PLP-dependent aminotransferase family protein [Klebsiella aerogenes]HEP0586170.1 PLP-dependent aminotransferase family protein [Klebsiella aerogenes]